MSDSHRELAEAGWRWVLDQLVWDADGPWLPETVPHDDVRPATYLGLHSGLGGLAHVLAEVRLARPWTTAEGRLAEAIVERLADDCATATEYDLFDGAAGHVDALLALGADPTPGVRRLLDLATPDGWPQQHVGPPRYADGARLSDATIGTAGVLLAGLWARRHGVAGAGELARHAAGVLAAEAAAAPSGVTWRFVPVRFHREPRSEMPNWSHGLAGIAAAVALAGGELDRPDLLALGRAGAEQLVALGTHDDAGFRVPRQVPPVDSVVTFAWGWCHGPSGTSSLFAALDHLGVEEVAGTAPRVWRARCWDAVRGSGIPARLKPGFWDNDGRCCGTAGVVDLALDAGEVGFAVRLGDALVERAERDGDRAWWRFVEPTADDPLLPPGTGWMQGAAGIAAALFRLARGTGPDRDLTRVPRADTWWAGPPAFSAGS
ncbi:hypothetical protein GCM10023340_44850 [Nocardioides marinquilinus]|uniref:Lanthionine synthetase n=1 Tax=Nocardioides marinquilinus TaxID=1210400 RepID=A0ABP9Q9K6_9ACTN